jgi:predicted transcriptional regulator
MFEKILEVSTRLNADDFTCLDLIRCVFNLKETEIRVLRSIDNKGKTVAQLSKTLQKDRSTIHRSLEKLMTCNLCYKQRKSGKKRGFLDYYFSVPEYEILAKAEKNLDSCYTKMKHILRELKTDENI